MVPSEAGSMVKSVWMEIPRFYPGTKTEAFVIMPNHVHGILVIDRSLVGAGPRACPRYGTQPGADTFGRKPHEDDASAAFSEKTPDFSPVSIDITKNEEPRIPSLPNLVLRFKALTTRRYIEGIRTRDWPPFDRRLWQRNYFEHIIRNHDDLLRILKYISDNPKNWLEDEENPGHWRGAER